MQAYPYGYIEFRRREYIGDALLGLVARKYFCGDVRCMALGIKIVGCITSNRILARIGERMGLSVHQESEGKKYVLADRHFADALEVKFYEVYYESGIDGVEKFFAEIVVPAYFELEKSHKEEWLAINV